VLNGDQNTIKKREADEEANRIKKGGKNVELRMSMSGNMYISILI